MKSNDIEWELYKEMCNCCFNAKKCHEECENCEEYENELERRKEFYGNCRK